MKNMITRSRSKKLYEDKQSKLHSVRNKSSVKWKKNKGKHEEKTGQPSKKIAATTEKSKDYPANKTKKCVKQRISNKKQENKTENLSKKNLNKNKDFTIYSENEGKKCGEQNSKKKQGKKRGRPYKKDVDRTEEGTDYSAHETKKYEEEHENKRETILHWLEQLDIQNIDSKVDKTVSDSQESSSYTSDLLEELNLRQRSKFRKTDNLGCLRCKHFLDIPKNLLQLPSKRVFSPLVGHDADLSFIQAISWLKTAILTMSNVSSEEFHLIFHKQWANQNSESIKKKVKTVYKSMHNIVDTVDKQKCMDTENVSSKNREMPIVACSSKATSTPKGIENMFSPLQSSRNISTSRMLTPQRNYGNCMLNTQVIEESDQDTSISVTPNTLQLHDNVLNPGLNRDTTWDSYRNSQDSQSNFNVKVNLLRSCPLISNISYKSSPSMQTCVSNVWNDIDIESHQTLPTPTFNNLDLVVSQLNSSTFHTSESSLEIIQMLGPAFITPCSKYSKITKCSKSSSDAMLNLVEQCPSFSSNNDVKLISDSAPVCKNMPTKTVESSESLQFDSAYDTCNMYASDTLIPLDGSTVEKTNNYEFPIQWEYKNVQNVIRAENNLSRTAEKIMLKSSVTDTSAFREKQSEVKQIKNNLKKSTIESNKMSPSLLARCNRYETKKKNVAINRNVGEIRSNVSAKHQKQQLIDEVIAENKERETTVQIPTQFLNYTLGTLQVDDALHESVKVIMSVFEKDEIAEMYMKRKRWKGSLEEEAVNAILNLSDILEVEKKFGVHNKKIVNVIESVLTNILDSTSLNKSSLWIYHIQIILQFCNSMRICVKIITFLITRLEAFQSMLSESNYEMFRRFNQLHFIFYGLNIVVQKFQSVRSCKLHESCKNPIPPVTDLWKRQWNDSAADDDMDILQVTEKRWTDSLESFAVTCVGELPQFAVKARRLFLMLIEK